MTDKEIIIDGVDVSGCCQYMPRHMEDYDIDTLDYCKYHFKPCKDVDVKYCYYKQLKQKERECQRAEQKLTLIRDFITDTQIYNMAHSICDKILQIIDEVDTDGRK